MAADESKCLQAGSGGDPPPSGEPPSDLPPPIQFPHHHESPTTAEAGGGEPPAEDVRLALDILRSFAQEEIERVERLGSRGRSSAGVAAGFFAVAQTVAFRDGKPSLTPVEAQRVAYLAIVATVLLAAAAVLLLISERRGKTVHVPVHLVADKLDDDEYTPAYAYLIWFEKIASSRRQAAGTRARWVGWVHAAAAASITFTALELLLSVWWRT